MDDYISREAEIQFFNDLVDDLDKQINDSVNYPHLRSDYKVCKTQLLDCIHAIKKMPAADVVQEENILKFYYVRSIDEYWIGRRLDNLYYARYESENQQWVWTHSRYLPWGEHVVSPTSLWKEYTYPSEPEEIPFTDWLKGFAKKYIAADVRPVVRGKWIEHDFGGGNISYECSECHEVSCCNGNYCTDCGADMRDSNLDTTKGDSHD